MGQSFSREPNALLDDNTRSAPESVETGDSIDVCALSDGQRDTEISLSALDTLLWDSLKEDLEEIDRHGIMLFRFQVQNGHKKQKTITSYLKMRKMTVAVGAILSWAKFRDLNGDGAYEHTALVVNFLTSIIDTLDDKRREGSLDANALHYARNMIKNSQGLLRGYKSQRHSRKYNGKRKNEA